MRLQSLLVQLSVMTENFSSVEEIKLEKSHTVGKLCLTSVGLRNI